MSPEAVTYEERDGAAWLTLNRPDLFNAIDHDCLDALEAHLARANEAPGVWSVVIAGQGRHFCTGADLDVVQAAVAADAFDAFLVRWHEVFAQVEASGKPTIAAVHGLALAGGFELTQVCDIVLLDADGALGDQHSKRGLFPGGGSTQRLPRMVGRRRALWMLLTGDRIAPEVALEWGLASEVVPSGEVMARAAELTTGFAASSRSTSRAIKAAVAAGAALPLGAALELDRTLAVAHMGSSDAAVGLRSFAERTAPVFQDP